MSIHLGVLNYYCQKCIYLCFLFVQIMLILLLVTKGHVAAGNRYVCNETWSWSPLYNIFLRSFYTIQQHIKIHLMITVVGFNYFNFFQGKQCFFNLYLLLLFLFFTHIIKNDFIFYLSCQTSSNYLIFQKIICLETQLYNFQFYVFFCMFQILPVVLIFCIFIRHNQHYITDPYNYISSNMKSEYHKDDSDKTMHNTLIFEQSSLITKHHRKALTQSNRRIEQHEKTVRSSLSLL